MIINNISRTVENPPNLVSCVFHFLSNFKDIGFPKMSKLFVNLLRDLIIIYDFKFIIIIVFNKIMGNYFKVPDGAKTNKKFVKFFRKCKIYSISLNIL